MEKIASINNCFIGGGALLMWYDSHYDQRLTEDQQHHAYYLFMAIHRGPGKTSQSYYHVPGKVKLVIYNENENNSYESITVNRIEHYYTKEFVETVLINDDLPPGVLDPNYKYDQDPFRYLYQSSKGIGEFWICIKGGIPLTKGGTFSYRFECDAAPDICNWSSPQDQKIFVPKHTAFDCGQTMLSFPCTNSSALQLKMTDSQFTGKTPDLNPFERDLIDFCKNCEDKGSEKCRDCLEWRWINKSYYPPIHLLKLAWRLNMDINTWLRWFSVCKQQNKEGLIALDNLVYENALLWGNDEPYILENEDLPNVPGKIPYGFLCIHKGLGCPPPHHHLAQYWDFPCTIYDIEDVITIGDRIDVEYFFDRKIDVCSEYSGKLRPIVEQRYRLNYEKDPYFKDVGNKYYDAPPLRSPECELPLKMWVIYRTSLESGGCLFRIPLFPKILEFEIEPLADKSSWTSRKPTIGIYMGYAYLPRGHEVEFCYFHGAYPEWWFREGLRTAGASPAEPDRTISKQYMNKVPPGCRFPETGFQKIWIPGMSSASVSSGSLRRTTQRSIPPIDSDIIT